MCSVIITDKHFALHGKQSLSGWHVAGVEFVVEAQGGKWGKKRNFSVRQKESYTQRLISLK